MLLFYLITSLNILTRFGSTETSVKVEVELWNVFICSKWLCAFFLRTKKGIIFFMKNMKLLFYSKQNFGETKILRYELQDFIEY